MKLKTIYLVLCFFGLLLPYSQFVPWLATNGLDLRLMWQQLFINQVSGFFAFDVLLSSLVLILFMHTEGGRLGVRSRWLPLLALLTVGVSLALPLFLYLRELRIEQSSAGTRMANA
jgi:hypothetical protein